MNPRAIAAILSVAMLLGACASSPAAPSWTYDPEAGASEPSGSVAVASPSALPSVTASAEPTSPGEPSRSQAVQTGRIPVVMTDAMRFVPERIAVPAGNPITFVVRNDGLIVHEFFVGDEAEQEAHAKEMAAGAMGHGHDNAVSVDPGQTGLLTMTFADAGTLLIGCHEPGHYAAGMRGTLSIIG